MFFRSLYSSLFFFCAIYAADKESFFDGAAYSAINQVQQGWARPLIAKIQQNTHDSILDIGCGTAEITAELAQALPNAKVEGIDPNESMLAYGRKKFQQCANLNLIQGSAPRYLEGCKPNGYSTVVSFSALHWLLYNDIKRTVKAAHAIVKDNGCCYFLTAGRRPDKQKDFLTIAVNNVIARYVQLFDKDDVQELDDTLCMLTEDEFKTVALEAGFANPDVELKKADHVFTSTQGFRDWLDGVSPYKKIVGEMHDAFLDMVVQEYCKVCPLGADGSLTYSDYMLYAILKKN